MIVKSLVRIVVLVGVVVAPANPFQRHLQAENAPKDNSPDRALRQDGLAKLQAELARSIESAPKRVMKNSGVAGVMGGAHVRVSSSKPQEILLPIPQLADSQVPLCYFITSTPADAVLDYRLRKREDNTVVVVRLAGKKQEVQIRWSSVVLLTAQEVTPNRTPADPYSTATACVQSQAEVVTQLAVKTWPKTGKIRDFAANIQRKIREMKRVDRPRSLDAVGMLRSGENGICTANANLAAALMRSKKIACRLIAVVPPISQRLEMHRIVEFFDNGRWLPFDPSSLQTDIPTKPWQNIIMAKSTPLDEREAMKLRRGAMLGCPYGQEIEVLTSGVDLFGPDFFWTMAKPLADLKPAEEATWLAAEHWLRYLKTGTLSREQLRAGSVRTATALADIFKKP